jgi:hypothetical protein
MSAEENQTAEPTGQVVSFRPRAARSDQHGRIRDDARKWAAADRSPVKGMDRYERAGEDDYRHRMTMNLLALIVCLLLAASGVWLANKIAEMRKNQDCVLSGRIGCTHVEVPPRESL